MVNYFFIDEKSISENTLVQILSNLNQFVNKYTYSDTAYEVSNFLLNIFNYTIFPVGYIFKTNSLIINLSIMIEIFTFLLIIHLISKSKNNIYIQKKIIYYLIICSSIYLLIMPQVLFNFGLNIRQKWMIAPFLIYLSFLQRIY